MNTRSTARFFLLSLLLATASVRAATLEQQFMNDFETDGIVLWSVDPTNMTLTGASFGANMNGWTVQSNSLGKLVMGGPAVAAAAGRFNVAFNYVATPFKVEWAELFFVNAVRTVRGAGTLTFNGGGWSNSNEFTHLAEFSVPAYNVTATPLPASVVMLASALTLVSLTSIRRRAAA